VEEASAAARAMHEQAGELSRQVNFFRFGEEAVAQVAVAKPKAAEIMAETEAVFAAVRQSAPAPARRAAPETADSGVWKEF
jgi:hypothetical protein